MCLQISFKLFFFHVKKYIINHSDIFNKKMQVSALTNLSKVILFKHLNIFCLEVVFFYTKKNNFKRIITLFILLFIYAILFKS